MANNSLNPVYWRVVKYYELKKQIFKELEIPFVLAYTRPIVQGYQTMNYNDRVDIDIETAIIEKYPGSMPKTIIMDSEATFDQVKKLAVGIHYNAAIQFVDEGVITSSGIKHYVYPGRIEQLLSLYVQDEQNAKYLSNELSVFPLKGGGIIDYHVDEMNCNCQKLAFHPLFSPALIYISRDCKQTVLFYNLDKQWDQIVILSVEDIGVGKQTKVLFGDDVEARPEMSWLIIEVADSTKYYRIGTSGNDTQLFQNTKNMLSQLFCNHKDNRVETALSALCNYAEL